MSCLRVNAGRRRGFVCLDDGPLAIPNPDCPNADQHEPQPTGYVATSAWADTMLVTHDQQQCPACALWVIWTPKPDGAVAGAAPTNPTACATSNPQAHQQRVTNP